MNESEEPNDQKEEWYSQETCIRCRWVMGNPPKSCVELAPHIFPSQVANVQDPGNLNEYSSLECFVAGAISTLRPFANRHPYSVLPIARRAVEAMGSFKPPLFEREEIGLD